MTHDKKIIEKYYPIQNFVDGIVRVGDEIIFFSVGWERYEKKPFTFLQLQNS